MRGHAVTRLPLHCIMLILAAQTSPGWCGAETAPPIASQERQDPEVVCMTLTLIPAILCRSGLCWQNRQVCALMIVSAGSPVRGAMPVCSRDFVRLLGAQA